MRTPRWTGAAVLTAIGVILAACGLPGGFDAGGAVPTLNKTVAGETCVARPRSSDAQTSEILCGPAVLVGALTRRPLQDGDTLRRRQIEVIAKEAVDAAATPRLVCGDGAWLAFSGTEALVLPCSFRDGNWPALLVGIAAEKRIFVALGAPALLPVFADMIGRDTGISAPFGDAASALRQIEATLHHPMPVVGAAEMADYRQLIRLARLKNSQQDFAGAESAERRVLEIQSRAAGATSAGAGAALLELALDVSNQGRFEEADALFRRAESVIESSPSATERGRLAAYRALDAANRGQYADALKFARTATALRRSDVTAGLARDGAVEVAAASGRRGDEGEVAHGLLIEAAMALRVNDMPSAEAAATEALKIVADTQGLPLWWRPEALMIMGDINAHEGRFAVAERNYSDALAFRQRLFGEGGPTALAHMALGRLFLQEELYVEAFREFRLGFASAGTGGARVPVTADHVAAFIAAGMAVATRDEAARPDVEAELFRAIQLVDTGVASQTAARTSTRLALDDPALAALLRELQDIERKRDGARVELADETAKPDEERSGSRETRLAGEITTASAAAEALRRQIEEKFPAYTRLAEPGAASLDDLRGRLGKGEALLSFVIGREQSFAVLVRRGGTTIRALKIDRARLATEVAELLKAFEPRGTSLAAFDIRLAAALHRELLGSLSEALAGVTHLVVIANGALASLPLALLVEKDPDAGAEHDYVRAAWLARRLAISEAPSVRAFLALRTARRPVAAPNSFLGIGAPAFVGPRAVPAGGSALERLARRCRDDRVAPADLLREMAPLPETAAEVRTVGRLLGGGHETVLLGADATEAGFRAQHPERFRVLYFATHGLLPGELHCQSEPALVLSPPAAAGTKAEDGLLEASEVAALKLDAELVVLSACNTAATGRQFGGDALAGLADAFFYAGARTLLASHWQVPSAETTRLMTSVFERMTGGGGRGVAEPLRQAQLLLLERPATAHPYFWAAFTVIGDGAPGDGVTARALPSQAGG